MSVLFSLLQAAQLAPTSTSVPTLAELGYPAQGSSPFKGGESAALARMAGETGVSMALLLLVCCESVELVPSRCCWCCGAAAATITLGEVQRLLSRLLLMLLPCQRNIFS
jgi:hypothetical protein